MKSFTMLSVALSSTLATAQVFVCDGYRRPDWNDCATVVSDFNMEGSSEVLHENGRDDPEPSCRFWYKNDGNCIITHCFQDTTHPEDDPRTRTGGEIFSFYDPIRSRCTGIRAGGEYTGALEFLTVFNDEDQGPVPTKRTIQRDNGIIEGHLSLEEYLEWRNETASTQERENNSLLNENTKRQNDDDVVRIDFTAYGIRNPNAFENGPRLSRGVGYKYEVSESTTFGVTTTLSLGGSWNVFTASAGIEMSQSDTYSVTEGLTFNVDCTNQGQVTFWPFYDYYETTWSPSETKGEIWVPVESGDKKISGEIAIACQG